MAGGCDPSAELWPASYRGASFYVMNDEEAGGRRLVVHEFPGRDDPFLEDLGAKARKYEVTAYLASETATSAASALTAACDRRGSGSLVLPTHGPIQVRVEDFKRSRERDKLGYIAYTLSCVREGFGFALASGASLANLIFAAADGIEAAIGGAFAAGLTLGDVPDYVVDAAVSGFATAVSAIDIVRMDSPVDPIVSSAQGAVIADLAANALQIVPAEPEASAISLVAAARAIGDGLDPTVSTTAFLALADAAPAVMVPETASANRQAVSANTNAGSRLLRLAALTAYSEGLARIMFASRPEGVTARADAAEYLDAELEACSGAGDADLFDAIEAMRNSVVAYLSNVITTLAPVITVETRLRLPAIVMAYRLYQDPARAEEIVARNAVRVPGRLPLEFEALAA